MNFSSILCCLGAVALLAGCATGAVYEQTGWTNPSAGSDWDIDSAVCLQESETLTDEDLKEVASIQESAQLMGDTVGNLADTFSTAYSNDSYGYLEAAAGIFSGSQSITAEEQVKQNKFAGCLEKKGWKGT